MQYMQVRISPRRKYWIKIYKDWLQAEYLHNKRSIPSLAQELNCSLKTIAKAMKKFGIKGRVGKKCENFAGQKIGKWTLMRKVPKKDLSLWWFCKCQCGRHKKVMSGHLNPVVGVGSKSCGRCQYIENVPGSFWALIRKSARERNIKFEITDQFLYKLYKKQKGKCALTGIKIFLPESCGEFSRGLHTASVDRINSSKSYTKHNVHWVHKDINRMKWCYSKPYFIKLCKAISDYNK